MPWLCLRMTVRRERVVGEMEVAGREVVGVREVASRERVWCGLWLGVLCECVIVLSEAVTKKGGR